MSRSYRLFIAAALGWLALAGTAQNQHDQGGQAKSHPANHQAITPTAIIEPRASANFDQNAQEQCITKDGKQANCTAISVQAAVDQARDADWQANAAVAGVLIGLITMGAAIAAAIWAKSAANHTGSGVVQAKRAADAAHDANRPWVSFEPRGRVRVTPYQAQEGQGFKVDFEIIVKNHGKSPANFFFFDIDVTLRKDAWGDFLKIFMEKWRCERGAAGGDNVFPDKDQIFPVICVIFQTDIDGKSLYIIDNFINPEIALCATYKSPLSDEYRQTGMLLTLGLDKGAEVFTMINISNPDWWRDGALCLRGAFQQITI